MKMIGKFLSLVGFGIFGSYVMILHNKILFQILGCIGADFLFLLHLEAKDKFNHK